jgi:hypothetical protein
LLRNCLINVNKFLTVSSVMSVTWSAFQRWLSFCNRRLVSAVND